MTSSLFQRNAFVFLGGRRLRARGTGGPSATAASTAYVKCVRDESRMAETPLSRLRSRQPGPRHLRGNAQALRRIGAGGRRLQDDKSKRREAQEFHERHGTLNLEVIETTLA